LQHGPVQARVDEVRETAPDEGQKLPADFQVL
jgi:hypothetical protein